MWENQNLPDIHMAILYATKCLMKGSERFEFHLAAWKLQLYLKSNGTVEVALNLHAVIKLYVKSMFYCMTRLLIQQTK